MIEPHCLLLHEEPISPPTTRKAWSSAHCGSLHHKIGPKQPNFYLALNRKSIRPPDACLATEGPVAECSTVELLETTRGFCSRVLRNKQCLPNIHYPVMKHCSVAHQPQLLLQCACTSPVSTHAESSKQCPVQLSNNRTDQLCGTANRALRPVVYLLVHTLTSSIWQAHVIVRCTSAL